MQRAAAERAAADSAAGREHTTVPGPRVGAAGRAVRIGSRPGFRGIRPLIYQLLAFSAAAIPAAVIAVSTHGVLLFYAEPDGTLELAGTTLAALAVGTAALYGTTVLLTFRSAAPLRGPLARRFALVLLALFATQGVLAVALGAVIEERPGASASAILGLLAALGVTLPAGFAALLDGPERRQPRRRHRLRLAKHLRGGRRGPRVIHRLPLADGAPYTRIASYSVGT